jgi:hypothetical protein
MDPGSGGHSTGDGGSVAAGGRVATGGRIGAGGDRGTGGSIAIGGRGGDTGIGGELGAGGLPTWACGAAIPNGYVRPDGPENPAVPCDQLSDALILARYDDPDAKVPKGFYVDTAGQLIDWDETACSNSLDDTVAAASAALGGSLLTKGGLSFYFDVGMCDSGMLTHFRQFKCSYYDGKRISTGDVDGSAALLLAGMLWYSDSENQDGSVLVSGAVNIGDAANFIELCTTKTTYGDFGLCDQITLESTRFNEAVDGTITMESPKDIRTLKGTCH